MQPIFGGNVREKRTINLGGASTSHSANADISKARLERLQREELRRQHVAATVLQAQYRGKSVRQRIVTQLRNDFDAIPLNATTIVNATRLLLACSTLVQTEDLQRISKWSRAVVVDKLLFGPFAATDGYLQQEWAHILRMTAERLLRVAVKFPSASQTPLALEIVKMIVDPSKYPPDAKSYAIWITSGLVLQSSHPPNQRQKLFAAIRSHLLAIPESNKTAPSLQSAISLALKALATLSQDGQQRSPALLAFIQQILTIPLLSQRIPASVATALANALPYADLFTTVNKIADQILKTANDAVCLLTNLTHMVEPRIASFKNAAEFAGWCETIVASLQHIPLSVITSAYSNQRAQSKGKGKAAEHDMDVDEPTFAEWPHDSGQLILLARLSGHPHISAILTASSRFSSSPLSRPALAKVLDTILACVPSQIADDTRTSVVYDAKHGGAGLVREIWRGWLRSSSLMRHLGPAKGKDAWKEVSRFLSVRDASNTPPQKDSSEWHLLILLVHLYSRTLATLGDDEFYPSRNQQSISQASTRNPLQLEEVQSLSGLLRNIAFALYWSGDVEADKLRVPDLPAFKIETCRDLFRSMLVSIHERDSRRPFLPTDHFIMTSAFDVNSFIETAIAEDQRIDEIEEQEAHPADSTGADSDTDLQPAARIQRHPVTNGRRNATMSRRRVAFISPRLGLLNNIPFVIPFETRVSVFRQLVNNDRIKVHQGSNSGDMFGMRSRGVGGHMATIRRDRVAEDGFNALRNLGPDGLKGRLQIQFVDVYGQVESGIDGGGLFKEFLTSLSQEAFDTNRGLWRSNSRQEVYPAPHRYAREAISLQWYRFLGQIVGKALYEGILVAIPFAGFFLSKWLGRVSYVDDLASLDPELYNGLVSLKSYQGDVRDLSLTFAIDEEDMGVSRTVDLVPGGRDLQVTNDNRHRYITLVSHYRLNAEIREQSNAFVGGLHDIINPRWLRLFSQHELKVLVGGTEAEIDIDDLRSNSVYAGIDESSETIRHFWSVLKEFDGEQRRAFIRFVTSADKAPLLGFRELQPHFAIRNGGSDESRLPTSSTCVNLLKLPTYSHKSVLKQKLLMAINAQAGFDLS